MLTMAHELEVAKLALACALHDLPPNATISVLLNGASDPEFAEQCRALPHIAYYESHDNLGVAGGRNFLFQTEEARRADVVMVLDNDVMLPRRYFQDLLTALSRHPDAAIIGPAIIHARPFLARYARFFPQIKGAFGCEFPDWSNRDIREIVVRDLSAELFEHLGTNPNWRMVYLSPWTHIRKLIPANIRRIFFTRPYFYGSLASDPEIQTYVRSNAQPVIEVANIGGGSAVMRREILEQLGLLSDLFSPYGLEDADLSIRALKAGYRNLLIGDCFLIHGTDVRHRDRVASAQFQRKMTNDARVRTLLAKRHTKFLWQSRLTSLLIIESLFHGKKPGKVVNFMRMKLRGKRQALAQLRGDPYAPHPISPANSRLPNTRRI